MPLRDDLLNPIPGDNPSGANLRYDPVTDKIKEARREDLDVPQGDWKTALKTADHPLVIKLASDALVKKGKDLQLAVWLVDAHIRREGIEMLAPCFYFLRDLLEQFWDTLYPEIEDDDVEVRAAPLEWLGTKLAEPLGFLPIMSNKMSWLSYQESRTVGYEADADTPDKEYLREQRISEGKITAEQFDEAIEAAETRDLKQALKALEKGLKAAEELSEFCDEKFGEFSPSFIKTRNAIDEIAQTVRIIIGKKPPEPDEAEESLDDVGVEVDESLSSSESEGEGEEEAATPGSVAQTWEEMSETVSVTATPGSIDDAAEQLAKTCAFLRQLDPEDPSPYMILRSFAWADLMKNAPMLNRAAIEAPPSFLRVNLKRTYNEGKYDEVLKITEEAILQPYGRYWLDLQRFTAQALEQLGYPGTSRVVNNCLRILLESLPELVDVELPDDTPAANTDTKNWITNFVIRQVYLLKKLEPPPEESSESSDSSSDMSFDTPSSDFSFDTPSDTPTEEVSLDSSFEMPAEPEPEATPEPAPEPEPYEVEANPPILEEEAPPPSDISDEFGQALEAVRDGRTADGLAIIYTILATERSGRARFRRRTQLAHLLMAAGKTKVALPLLDELTTEIDERRLENWEPSEALAYPLELLLHCLSPAEDERRTQLYTRICKLDPVRAVNCSF